MAKKTKTSSAQEKSAKAPKGATAKTGHSGRKKADPTTPSAASTPSSESATGFRVRMFRVGFGDFFLLSIPARDGAKHILVDCGVHAKDLNSIRDAVAQMAKDCDLKLALVVMTHRHADHISGFGTCKDVFSQFTVERVWMPWFENPTNATAVAFQAGLTALAGRLQVSLAARGDGELADMAENITGGMAAAGGTRNQDALNVLHHGFRNTPEHDFYKAGDAPILPKDLMDAGLSAQILGPPIDAGLIAQMNNKAQQYLTDGVELDDAPISPFNTAFRADSSAYPSEAFNYFDVDRIKAMVDGAQPDVLAARAAAADKTLNNQSLVILFSFGGKHLLFAGDAQWGNWENFLYGGAYGTPGHTEITDQARAILGKIDFYKVGHHGSTNATPKDAVAAMRQGCVGMCSTQVHAYNGVPREPLLQALSARMNGQLARSDQVAANERAPANPDAGLLPSLFKRPTGMLFIDYNF